MAERVRLDKLLVDQGLAPSRERAQALIMAGEVLVDDRPITKPGLAVPLAAALRLRGEILPYVSRGGLKLAGALDDLGLDVTGATVLDVGASTGGFSDCCLQRGAARIFAVDVGHNQLAWKLRQDARVICLEGVNARQLSAELLPGPADLAVIDVSFISLAKILPAVLTCLAEPLRVLAMVKPQFEVGPDKVGKGGVVRDADDREAAISAVIAAASELGLTLLGRADARIRGPKGNQETFLHLIRKGGTP